MNDVSPEPASPILGPPVPAATGRSANNAPPIELADIVSTLDQRLNIVRCLDSRQPALVGARSPGATRLGRCTMSRGPSRQGEVEADIVNGGRHAIANVGVGNHTYRVSHTRCIGAWLAC